MARPQSILAINTGSTSLKFGLFRSEDCHPVLEGDIDWANGQRDRARLRVRPMRGEPVVSQASVPDDFAAVNCALDAVLKFRPPDSGGSLEIAAIGHRVVHGGAEFRESTRITPAVKAAIGALAELAPLHNPPALRAIEAAEQILPQVPQVAVFDTAFFTQLPPRTFLYPLPYEYYQQYGVRRFGFHGISHAYCAQKAAEILSRPLTSLKLINCHLGGGCSATAVQNGMAVGTTTGFSPLEGLMMGSRPGSLDPGALIHLLRQPGMDLAKLDADLNRHSGLKGISGISADLAQIEAAAANGHERARLAFDMFAERVTAAIGSLAALMGGVDVLSFTDRIGEQSARLRSTVCGRLGFLGFQIDEALNAQGKADTDLSAAGASGRVLMIHTCEELMVAREARRVVG